jgi:hypothetical protein
MPAPKDAAVQVLSERTLRTYAADWALFADWCDATDQIALPADPVTVLGFLAGGPATVSTQRVRVTAIDHQHTATGYALPGRDPAVLVALGRPIPGPYEPAPETVAAVGSALRFLPSHGWTNGMFGRRDRCPGRTPRSAGPASTRPRTPLWRTRSPALQPMPQPTVRTT